MGIKTYNPTSQQWEDYNEELVNETVGKVFLGNEWKIAWQNRHAHNGVRFTRWTSTNSLPSTAGNYVLMNDVTLSSVYNAPTGITKICLNGHKIVGSSSDRCINITNSNELHLYDCNHTKSQHSITNMGVDSDTIPSVSISGGVITGCSTKTPIYLNGTAKLYMYGGTIAGNNNSSDATSTGTKHAGGIILWGDSEAHFYDGEIAYNAAVNGGGGIALMERTNCYVHKKFKISKNKSGYGGGIFVNTSGNVVLNGIEILGNACISNATAGGGGGIQFSASYSGITELLNSKINDNKSIHFGGGIAFSTINQANGKVNIKDTEIKGNIASRQGGGIGIYGDNYAGNECTLKIGEGTIISNNTASYSGGGIYYFNGKLKIEGSSTIKNNSSSNLYVATNKKVFVTDELENADIGITMQTPGTFTSDYSTYNEETPDTFFSSDSSNYTVALDNNEAKLVSV